MSEEKTFQEAVQAVAQGQRLRARDQFTRLLKKDSSNPEYWLWLSAVVDTTSERIYCLENVLRLDPNNPSAIRGLILLGARKADETLPPAPLIHRKWHIAPQEEEVPKTPLQRLMSNRLIQVGAIILALLIVVGLVSLGAAAVTKETPEEVTFIRVSITAIPSITPTATLTPTPTRTPNRSVTPTLMGATPLWVFLEATYTPVPPYVDTPHPILESYKIAMRSYSRGDYANMVTYLEQASRDDPASVDILYQLGQAYRLIGDNERALQTFEKAIAQSPGFAPSYLGRAQVISITEPKEDILKDLDKAIELDPNFPEAYLFRAEHFLKIGDAQGALNDLQILDDILPYEEPRIYWLRAQILLAQGEYAAALQDAEQANLLDMTLVPAYLTLAQAQLANHFPRLAIENVQVYLRYEKEDPLAWSTLGQAQLENGEDSKTILNALNQAILLDDQNAKAYWYRGRTLLDLGQNQEAVNDLVKAVRLDETSFDYNVDLGHALLAAERYADAFRQLNAAEKFAETDSQKAAVYYWRAQTLEASENLSGAKAEWKSFLALPAEAIPADWLAYGRQRLLILEPPTATPTLTSSVTQTSTVTLTPSTTSTPTTTFTVTPTRPTSTPTPRQSATPTPRSTASATPKS